MELLMARVFKLRISTRCMFVRSNPLFDVRNAVGGTSYAVDLRNTGALRDALSTWVGPCSQSETWSSMNTLSMSRPWLGLHGGDSLGPSADVEQDLWRVTPRAFP
jgi:hypothetical protein